MRILVLSKRQYTSKDLLDDRYGRLSEIPKHLARQGHAVYGLVLSYRKRTEYPFPGPPLTAGDVSWYSINLGLNPLSGIRRHQRALDRLVVAIQPDVIWACSDAFHVILAAQIKKRHNLPFIADLYDNFESFAATRLWSVKERYHSALSLADGITVVSENLRSLIRSQVGPTKPLCVLTNAIDPNLFYRRDKRQCRKKLGLPAEQVLIGTAGSLTRDRDIQVLYDAFRDLSSRDPAIGLAVAGPRKRSLPPPAGKNVYDLGLLPHDKIALLASTLDVAVICNKPSAFGEYCFPQKFYEFLAGGTPVLAAAVGALKELLAPWPQNRYDSARPETVPSRILGLIEKPTLPDLPIPTWAGQAQSLSRFMQQVLHAPTEVR